ncbi:MAG: hypothetical protein HOQ28_09365, partial [Thermoleophilia bacterium]|nr:hypothetical protein [Thermoleophilia bacterium]
RTVPRRPLVLIGAVGVLILGALVAGISSTDDLVRSTAACFIAVYVLAILSALRILDGRARGAAVIALVLTIVLAVFSARFLVVPAVAGAAALSMHRILAARRSRVAHVDSAALDPHDRGPRDLVVLSRADAEAVEPARAADA